MKLSITKEEINELPLGNFQGAIHLISSEEEVEKEVALLRREGCLGFDTETKPVFKKGQTHPISLIQLANIHRASIFRLGKIGMPKALKALLEDESVMKIALDPGFELKKLEAENGVTGKGFVDLAKISVKIGASTNGLRGLAALFLGIRISKSSQTSNWEREDLSEKQVLYAATDAWVTLRVYLEMKKQGFVGERVEFYKPEPKKKKEKFRYRQHRSSKEILNHGGQGEGKEEN